MQQTEVRLKLELNGEVRRVALVERSFQCLQKQVCKLFSLEDTNFSLKYKDDEGDLVTISSEEEFNEALGYLQNNLLRLKIIKLNKETQEGEQERGGRCGRFRKFMEFKKWKEAQKSEDKQDKEEDAEEECKPWKRFFVFKSPHGPQHPRHPHHHFHHHQRQEEQGENVQQHPFFPPRFGPHPHHPHHFHRHHHHGHQHQNEQEGENQKFFGFPPRPHHPHHFHRHHHHGHQHQEQEAPRFRFPPSDAPFGFFGRPHHHHRHQHQQEQQKEDVQPFDFLENLGNLAKNLFGGVLNGESSLEDLLESDIFKVEHNHICDGCDQPISGTRHHCTECPDFDFCSSCFETKLESHAQHKFEKVTAFEALKQALQNGQKIDAFFVKRNGEEASNENPKQEENKPEDKKPEPEQPELEQPKQEEITIISTNVEVPQPSETSIAVEPSTNVIQTPIENPSEPKPTEEVVVYPFQKKLEDLEVMGFTDRKKNILTLLKNKGDLELTIEQLLN